MVLRAGFHGTVGQPSAQVIDGSLKFDSSSSHYLNITPGSASNRRTWTASFWTKSTPSGSTKQTFFQCRVSSNSDDTGIGLENDKIRVVTGTVDAYITSRVLRDPSAWYHIVVVFDTTQSTASDRVKVYVNSELDTGGTTSYPSLNTEWSINTTNLHAIGRHEGVDSQYLNSNLSQFYLIDGQALGPEYFGFTDPLTNTWRPKKYTGTFGTNGFWLPLDSEDNFEKDKSGNGNDWTKNNFSGTSVDPDVIKDSPSGAVSGGRAQTGITTTSSAPANYCTLNPLDMRASTALSNGNLTVTGAAAAWYLVRSTQFLTTGKYYWEYKWYGGAVTSSSGYQMGLKTPASTLSAAAEQAGSYAFQYTSIYLTAGSLNTVSVSPGSTTAGDTVMFAYDADAGLMWLGVNGTWNDNADPATGTNSDWTSLPTTGLAPFAGVYGTAIKMDLNFGQKPFKYAPPQGFLPVNSASARPETVISRPDQFVGVTTYTGNNSTNRPMKIGFQPDLVWLKSRESTFSHYLGDSVRGKTKLLQSNSTATEITSTTGITSFDSDGFTLGNGSETNLNNDDMVAWCWKAGGNKNTFNVDDVGYASAAAAGLDGGSITPTGASVGTKQGFSIIEYTGDGVSGTSIPHGLTQKPDFFIVKDRGTVTNSNTKNWFVYHTDVGATKYILLNGTAGQTTGGLFNNTEPTSSVVYSSGSSTATDTAEYIMYAWHNVPGLQKFGSYTYTASRPFFVELGFKPAILWLKRTGSGSATNISYGSWFVADKERGKFNPVSYTESQWLNRSKVSGKRGDSGTSNAGTYLDIDLVSNGFVIPTTGGGAEFNQPNDVVVYCAWAEAPASNLFGGQSNAR